MVKKVWLIEEYKSNTEFEAAYLQLRQKEGRIYSDEVVLNLPKVPRNDLHYLEWKKRADSLIRFSKYIKAKQPGLQILEVGCGNGWLSNKLALLNNNKVLAADINMAELQQGARVFSGNHNLEFIYSDILSLKYLNKKFDLIVFAASIQYFGSLENATNIAKSLLNPNGEIHIFDSPFYKTSEIESAAARSRLYYEQLGFAGMEKFYFHHSKDEMEELGFEIMYSPKNVLSMLMRNTSPFFWYSAMVK